MTSDKLVHNKSNIHAKSNENGGVKTINQKSPAACTTTPATNESKMRSSNSFQNGILKEKRVKRVCDIYSFLNFKTTKFTFIIF